MTWTEPLYTAEEMRAAEAAYTGSTLELMERAGSAVALARKMELLLQAQPTRVLTMPAVYDVT